MRREVVITDAAAVSAAGPTLDALWRALARCETAIRDVTRFPTTGLRFHVAACAEWLDRGGCESLADALVAACVAQLRPPPADAALFMATTKGRIDCVERALRAGAPLEATDDTALELAAERLGLGATVRRENISAACASSTIAIGRAAAAIARGKIESAVVVGFDIVSQFVFTGFGALQALSAAPCRPFDAARDGLSLGEAAAALTLRSRTAADAEGCAILGRIEGWGVANDANHITAPARDGCGLVAAIEAALAKAGRVPGEIAAVNAHGTGTRYNDAMECVALRRVFGARRVPAHTIKGTVGHTLGAAGVLETCVALRALRERAIPPTANLEAPDEAAVAYVSRDAQLIGAGPILTINSGFGGVNAALVVGRREE